MIKFYVYLILSQNRLVIMETENTSSDYFRLMDNNGYDRVLQLSQCKLFCIGYTNGSKLKNPVINSVLEFS
jgi:hypothetical protein